MGGCLGLLTTCRQIYDEVSSLLRSERRFEIVQPKTISSLLKYRHDTLTDTLIGYICPDYTLKLSYDLDKGTVVKEGCPIYDISNTLRIDCMKHYEVRMEVMVSVSYPFRGLEEWAQSVCEYLEETRSACQYITLTLRLPKTESSSNTAFYLPAARLFRATTNLHPCTEFKVVAADEDEDKAYTGPLVELITIGLKLLIFVHHLLRLSSDPFNQPIPRIWMDKDLQISHAEIEDECGRSVHVPNSLGDYTSDEVYDKAYHLMLFFRGTHNSNTGVGDAAAPELAGYGADTIYAEDTLITLAQELAELCIFAY